MPIMGKYSIYLSVLSQNYLLTWADSGYSIYLCPLILVSEFKSSIADWTWF